MTLPFNAADPEQFRTPVGRYKERWYCDPLDACDLMPSTDWKGPSISTIKKAAGSDWTNVAINRIANMNPVEYTDLADMDVKARAEYLRGVNSRDLGTAAGRGTIVHLWAEDMLAGNEPRDLDALTLTDLGVTKAALDEAEKYKTALVAWFNKHQPKLLAAEIVVANRTLNGYGYGGTVDAWLEVDGKIVAVDWKTRTPTSRHGAYSNEAAQIAAGALADYCFVDNNGTMARAVLPDVDYGIVVSIKPDSCQTYPIDLTVAWNYWNDLHAWWCARRTENASIMKPWVDTSIDLDNLQRRAQRIVAEGHAEQLLDRWPPNVPTFKQSTQITMEHGQLIDSVLSVIEAEHGMPFDPPKIAKPRTRKQLAENAREANSKPIKPDDSEPADPSAIETLKTHYRKLSDTEREWINTQTAAAKHEKLSVSIDHIPSVRRFEIGRALVAFATIDSDLFNPALNTVGAVTGPAGRRIGALTTEQARQLAEIGRRIHDGETVVISSTNTLEIPR